MPLSKPPRNWGTRRLGLNAYSNIAEPLKRRSDGPDSANPDIVRSAAALTLDIERLGVLCGRAAADPDLFFGLWRLILDRMLGSAIPRISVAVSAAEQDGAPQIIFTQSDLQSIVLQRLEFPLFVTLGVRAAFLLTIALAYFGAGWLQGRQCRRIQRAPSTGGML